MATAHGSAEQLVVWVKLYIGDVESRNPLKIRMGTGEVVFDLKEAIRAKKPNDLNHCDADHLNVYAPGTRFPIDKSTEPMKGSSSPPDAKEESPLVVTAPPPPPQVSLPCNVVLISSLAFEFHRRSHRYFPSRKNLAT